MAMSMREVIEAIEAEMFSEVAQREAGEKYREILLLDTLLLEAGIPHELRQIFDGYKISYPDRANEVCSAIEHNFSYGNKSDLIEIMGLTQNNKSVEGGLSAQEVFDRILWHFRGCEMQL